VLGRASELAVSTRRRKHRGVTSVVRRGRIIARMAGCLTAVTLALIACSGGGNGQSMPSSSGPTGLPNSRTTAVPLSDSCTNAAQLVGGHEYRGAALPSGSLLWALAENDTATAGTHETKIRWRASGHGTPRIVAKGPAGQTVLPDQGVLFHISSDWTEPGTDEWGTNWSLPASGCWSFDFAREGVSGTVALQVG
jgi:hypothetical protein